MFYGASHEYLDMLMKDLYESIAVMNAKYLQQCKDCSTYTDINKHECIKLAIGA